MTKIYCCVEIKLY